MRQVEGKKTDNCSLFELLTQYLVLFPVSSLNTFHHLPLCLTGSCSFKRHSLERHLPHGLLFQSEPRAVDAQPSRQPTQTTCTHFSAGECVPYVQLCPVLLRFNSSKVVISHRGGECVVQPCSRDYGSEHVASVTHCH